MKEKSLSKETLIRQTKYHNNIVEQDHRFIQKITNLMLGFQSFLTANKTLKGIEAMHMIRKGQVEFNSSAFLTVDIFRLFGLKA
ncbi:MAG: integrase core domain protein [Bacilli bacterium]|nr:integrase core domain protein [Bacilli bacterium]